MPGAPSDARADLLRDRLRRAGEHRVQQTLSREALADEIKGLARDAESLDIPVAEVARLLGIDRSTLYRVYLNGS